MANERSQRGFGSFSNCGAETGETKAPGLCRPVWICLPLTLAKPAPLQNIWQAPSGTGLDGAARGGGVQLPERDKVAFLKGPLIWPLRLFPLCRPHHSCKVEDVQTGCQGPAQARCPRPALMACYFRTMRTHGLLCTVHLENFPDHGSAL